MQAKNDDAARKALQDMFKGRDDVLSQNEQTEEGGGNDGSGKGSGGKGQHRIHITAAAVGDLQHQPCSIT